jgi:hypothetical protein
VKALRLVFIVFLNVTALATVGLAATEWSDAVPLGFHAAVFAGGAFLSSALLFFFSQSFEKLDRVLEDTEQHQRVRTVQAYVYVRGLRSRLVLWLCGTIGALAACVTAAYALKDTAPTHPMPLVVAGYVGIAIAILTAVRVVTAYLSLDDFRLELLRAMDAESKRAAELRALAASANLPDSSTAPPMKVLSRR